MSREWIFVGLVLVGLALLGVSWFRRREAAAVGRLDRADALEAAILALTDADVIAAYRGGDDVDIEAAHVVAYVDRFEREEEAAITTALERALGAGDPEGGPALLRPATRIDLLAGAVGVRVRPVGDEPTPEQRLRGEAPLPSPAHLLVALSGPTVDRWMADAIDRLTGGDRAGAGTDRLASEAMTVAARAAARHFAPGDTLETANRLQSLAGEATAGALTVTAAATPVDDGLSLIRIFGVEGDPDRLVFPGHFPAVLGEAIRSVRAPT